MRFYDPDLVVNGEEFPDTPAVLADIEASLELLRGCAETLHVVRDLLLRGQLTEADAVLSFASVSQNGWDVTGPSFVRVVPDDFNPEV